MILEVNSLIKNKFNFNKGGLFTMIISYYSMKFAIKNCTFTSNSAQFGGIIFMWVSTTDPVILNITNSTFLSSNASKENTYIGDYSMGGILGSINNLNTLISFYNCLFTKTFSRTGFSSLMLK